MFRLIRNDFMETKQVGPSHTIEEKLASSIHKHSGGVRSAGSLRLAKSWELSGRNHVMSDIWSPRMPCIKNHIASVIPINLNKNREQFKGFISV